MERQGVVCLGNNFFILVFFEALEEGLSPLLLQLFEIVLWDLLWLGCEVGNVARDVPLLRLGYLDFDALANESLCWLVTDAVLRLGEDNFGVGLGVANELQVSRTGFFAIVKAHDPNKLLGADKVSICRVRVENPGDLTTACLLYLSVKLLPFVSYSAWSWIKL